MPSLEQLPEATAANATDLLLLDQSGTARSVSVQVLQNGLQPKLTLAPGVLLGRVSPAPGQPEPVGLGAGLALASGVLMADTTVVAALASPNLTGTPTAPTPTAGDASTRIATTAFVQAKLATPITLAGDITGSGPAPNGVLTTTLPSIAAPGTYASVTVNAKGQVTGGAALPSGGAVELQSNKGAPSGYAGLDATGKVPAAQLPATSGAVSSVAGQVGAVTAGQISTALGLGTLATESANAVSITGGSISNASVSSANVTAVGSSVARSLAARMSDSLNVLDFGADPTGATANDTAFVSADAAAASAGGKTIYVPYGTYMLSGGHNLNNNINTWIRGPGVTFSGAGFISPITDSYTSGQGIYRTVSGGGGQNTLSVGMAIQPSTGAQTYQQTAIHGHAVMTDPNTAGGGHAGVAYQAIAEIAGGSAAGQSQVWGMDIRAITQPGMYGAAIGLEIGSENHGFAAAYDYSAGDRKAALQVYAAGSVNSLFAYGAFSSAPGATKFLDGFVASDNAIADYPFRVINTSGATNGTSSWFSVDPSGNLIAASLSTSGTLSTTGNAAVSGNLTAAGVTSLFNTILGGTNLSSMTGSALNSTYGLGSSGRMLLGWNASGGYGETDLIINRGGGSRGGLRVYDFANSTFAQTQIFDLDSSGNLALPGSLTAAGGAFTTLSTSGLASHAGGIADASYSSQTPTTGFAITVANGVSTLQLTPAVALVSGTITMPSAPGNGQWLFVASTQTVAQATFTPASGQTIVNAPTSLPVGVEMAFQYQSSGARWICQSGNDVRVSNSASSSAMIFGTGADGNVSLSSGTTVLSRDTHWANCTLSGTAAVNTNGWRLFISGVLDISAAQSGAIICNGANGSPAAGASGGFSPGGLAMRTVGQSPISGGGGGNGSTATGSSGSAGTGNTFGNGGNGGNGGAGGASTGAGGAIGSGGTASIQIPLNTPTTAFFPPGIGTSIAAGLIGGGGGGGGGDGTNAGGGGGGAGSFGGMIALYVRSISRGTNANASIIQAKGGNGANGGNAAGGNAAGGGGGGGGGGVIYIITETLFGSAIANCLDASGGAGGAGGSGSGTGKGGVGGVGGSSGSVQIINLLTPSYASSAWNAPGSAGGTTSTTAAGASGPAASLRVTL